MVHQAEVCQSLRTAASGPGKPCLGSLRGSCPAEVGLCEQGGRRGSQNPRPDSRVYDSGGKTRQKGGRNLKTTSPQFLRGPLPRGTLPSLVTARKEEMAPVRERLWPRQ